MTTIGLDNTGFLKFDMDIEMGDKNVFNTTGSQLWRKVVLLFDAELKAQYSLMRQDRFTVDNIMKYLYGEQISQIPAYYYNKDMQTKYLNFGSSYLYALHGSGEQHIRKWIRERLMYCDTLLGYRASSSDYITLRSSKLGEVYLDVETYIPMYLSIKWRDEANNTGLQTKRVGRGEKVRFTYNMPTATDQEIIVYAGHYLKSLGDVSNLQPTSMLIANADRLTEIECHSPNLINTDLSECTKLQRIDLSDCTALGTGIGAQPILNIQNCKYLRYCDCRNTQLTAIYTMQAGGNLEEIYYPQSTQVVQLTNQTYLHTIGLPSTSPCKNLANVQITNCNAIKRLSSETTALDFNTLKYVQNLNITNSLSGLNSMQFNGFDKLKNVTLSSLKELNSIGFEDMMPVTTTSTLKNITISDCPLITSLSFNVSSDDYKVAFASNGKLDLGGLQSLKSIECNTSVKGLDTLIVPTSLTDLRFTTEHGDGINEIKNIWSASAVHNNDGFEGIDFQDMTIEFIDMLGLNGISNAINFHIAPKTQNPNLNTARDGSTDKPWFHPIGSIDLSNYTGLMIGMLRGVDLNKLDVVINTNRDQVDLTSLFECATLPTAQNIVTKTNNILAKFPKSVIWDYMFRGCDLSFSPKDITIPNRGLSLKGMYKDSNVTEDVSLPNVIMAVDEMFMNCTGITTYEENWLKTYAKIAYTVPASNGTSGSWDDNGNYTEGTNYNQFLYTLSDGEKVFKIMTTGTGVVRINYFHNASFMSRVVYTPKFDSYPYVVTIPDGCNKVIFVCDKTIGFASEGTITTSNCYTNTGGVLSEIPVSWGGYGLDKNVTSIYVIDTTHLTNTTTFNLVLNDNQAGITDWGDGITNSEKSHTYAEHGVYTIKTKSWSNGTPSDDLKNALIEVKQIKLIGHNGNSKDYSNAFNGCTNLRKVTTYDLAPTNCQNMFYNCTSLTEIVGLDTWDMSNCNSISGAFQSCTSLTTIPTIPNGVPDMNSTFRDCSSLTSVPNIPNSVTNMNGTFYGCTSLTTIPNMPNSVTNMYFTFCSCSSLTTVPNISNSVTNMIGAFQGCTSLTSVPTIPNSVTSMRNTFTGCSSLAIVHNISNSVTDMTGTFFNCTSLTSVPTIPNSVTSMDRTFRNCVLLTEVNLSNCDFNNITSFADIFNNCTSLTRVTLNNITDTSTREAGAGLRLALNSIPQPVEIVMDEIAMTDFSNLFQGVTKIKNDIVFPTNATNVSNCFKGCTSMTHVHSNWKTEYTAMENTTDCYAGCTGITHCDGVDLGVNEYITGLDEVPTAWGGYGFLKTVTSILVFEIPSDNYTLTLLDQLMSSFAGGSDYSYYNKINWGDGTITEGEISHTYTTAGTYTLKGHYFMGQWKPTASMKETLTEIKQIPKYKKLTTSNRYLATGCTKLKKVTINDFISNDNDNGLTSAFQECTALEEVYIKSSLDYYTKGIELRNAFQSCNSLKTVTMIGFKPNGCSQIFYNCSSLTEIIGLDTWDMSNCTNISNMFTGCNVLGDNTFLTMSEWNVAKITTYNSTFQGCKAMTNNNFMSSWEMSNCQGLMSTFQDCTGLIELDLSNKFLTGLNNIRQLCYNCTNLQTINLTNFIDKDNYSGELTTTFYSTQNPFDNCSSLQNNPYLQIGIGLASISFWGLTCVPPDILDLSEINTSNLQSFRYTGTATQIIGIHSNVPWVMSFRYATGVTVVKDLYYKHGDIDFYYYNAPAPNTFINFVTKEGSTAYKAENFGALGSSNSINHVLKLSNTNYNVNTFITLFNCLYDYASEGTSANYTLTLGNNLARLTDEQIVIATNKGWCIKGTNAVAVPAGMDLSSLSTDNNVTKLYVQLTSENSTSRIAELCAKYPNITEVYLFEDGTITEAVDIFTGVDNNIKAQITKVVFMEGYFNNVTLDIREYGLLDELPVAWGGFGFSKDVTSIIVVEIPSNNYEFLISTYNSSMISTGTINWGDGTVTTGSRTHTYATAGTYTIKAHIALGYYDPSDSIRNCLIEVKQIALSGIDKMFNLSFSNCTKLTKVTAYNLAPKRCDNMFKKCSLLTEIVGLDTWDMSNCTNFDEMFSGASYPVNGIFPDNFFYGGTMNGTFQNNNSLISIDLSNQGKFTHISNICRGCSNLETVNFNNLDLTETANFGQKRILDDCNKFRVLNMSNCIFGEDYDVSGFIDDASSLIEYNFRGSTGSFLYFNVFTHYNMVGVTTIDWGNIKLKDFDCGQDLPNLTVQSLLNTLNALYDYVSEGNADVHTCRIGSVALAKLTDEQIAIATNKGWTLQ